MGVVSAPDPWDGVDLARLSDSERFMLIQDRIEALKGHLDQRCMVLTADERDLILTVRREQAKREASSAPSEDMEDPASPHLAEAARSLLAEASESVALGARRDQGEYALVPVSALEALTDALLTEAPLPRAGETTR